MTIKGTVHHQDLSGGFWGIIDAQGKKWKPSMMPKALQKEGLKVSVEAEEASGGFSIFMWGTTIDIQSYTIL